MSDSVNQSKNIKTKVSREDALLIYGHQKNIINYVDAIAKENSMIAFLQDPKKGEIHNEICISLTASAIIALLFENLKLMNKCSLNDFASVLSTSIIKGLAFLNASGIDMKQEDFINIFCQGMIDDQKNIYEDISKEFTA